MVVLFHEFTFYLDALTKQFIIVMTPLHTQNQAHGEQSWTCVPRGTQ
jgi:hypothetical protein